jgi:hypothetical protein
VNCSFDKNKNKNIFSCDLGYDPDSPKSQDMDPDSMNLDFQKCVMRSTGTC